MQIIVKVKFDGSKQNIESFGNDRYLTYLPFEEDAESEKIVIHLLSRYIIAPPNKVLYKGESINKDFVFKVL